MKKSGIYIKSFLLIFICLGMLLLSGCGGGGGGGGITEAPLTAANAPQAGGAAIQTVNLVGAASALGELQTSSISSKTSSKTSSETYLKPPLRSILDKVISISKIQRHKSEVHTEGSMPPTTENCSGGGTITVSATWIGPDNPPDESLAVDFRANMTFNSCKEGNEILNGSMSMVFEGPLSAPTKLTVSTSKFTYADTAAKDSITMTNLNMVLTDFSFSGNELTGATIIMTGAVSGTVNGEPINVECDSYKTVFSSSGSGVTVSISGRIKASCLGGWVAVITNTPVFVPTGADCPTAGEIVVTSGGNSVKLVIASNSEITIYYNNTLVQTYNNCEDVDGLCVG